MPALQYLYEAFPIEQLQPAEHKALRTGLATAMAAADLPADPHLLIAGLAAGLGLDYRPVPYYRARLDQPELAFIGRHLATVALSARVGYDAGTEPGVVVRLAQPFLFDAATGEYRIGQALIDEEAPA